jgi:RHS repeat-associated protein
LGYYAGDYKPIIGTATAFNIKYNSQSGDITGQSLYNGNISNTTMTISSINSGNPVGYSYHYDQLNRLKAVRQHNLASTVFDKSNMLQDYAENLTYDGNGNILTNNRHGNIASGIAMDSLRYGYRYDSNGKLVDNRLHQVQDAVPDVNGYTADLKNQSDTGNYKYDAIGNLVLDTQAGLDSINWNVYGKIKSIYKNTGTINYSYSPGGQRVTKTAVGLTTYYVRDAHGNMIALYDNANNTRNWREQHTYGSDRLSMWQPNVNLSLAQVADTVNARYNSVGLTQYELKNHLGNVMTTISDKRIQHITGGDVDYYLSDITSGQDYYAFGMLQAGRQYTANYTTYRYGFNGKENDNDVKGEGNQQDYGMRISDPRLGRFLSVDPITANYPWYTPYQFAGNTPMQAIDIDGLEEYVVTNFLNKAKQIVETQISFITDKATKENVDMQLITVHGKTPISPNSKVLVRNLDFDTEKLLSYERRQALNARELAVLKTGDKEKIKGYDPFSVQIEMGQPLESTADDYSTKDYELVSLSKQFRIAKPSPPPVAEFSNGILMNPGISNTDSYNYAVNNIIVPNIQATIKEAISKGMNAGKLSISITIDAKPATNVTAVKRLILSAYPKANVIINSRPDVKVLPGSSMRKSNEDFNYTINVKGGKE